MSIVNITNIQVLNNPARFADPYLFKITFECISSLKDDLEWKLIYVGSAESESYDQELDTCMVGPVPVGVNSFEFEAAAPSTQQIPSQDLIGVTVILLTCSYNDQEFVRVGYYVNNEYAEETLRENPPEQPIFEKLYRNILAEKPRVTRFNIKWDGSEPDVKPTREEADMMERVGKDAVAEEEPMEGVEGAEGEVDDDDDDEEDDEEGDKEVDLGDDSEEDVEEEIIVEGEGEAEGDDDEDDGEEGEDGDEGDDGEDDENDDEEAEDEGVDPAPQGEPSGSTAPSSSAEPTPLAKQVAV